MTDPRPPGPRHLTPFPVSSGFRRDALGYTLRLFEQSGDVVSVRMGSRWLYFLFHPDDIEYVLQHNHRNYVKGPATRKAKVFFGRGLFTSEGPTWRRQRRLMQPTFRMAQLRSSVDAMTQCVEAAISRWEAEAGAGRSVNVVAEMRRLALSVVARALMDAELEDDPMQRTVFETVIAHLEHRTTSFFPIPSTVPTPRNLEFRRAITRLENIAVTIIEKRRTQPERNSDLLTTLLGARDEQNGEPLAEQELRDHVRTFLFAGHETTAMTLAWAMYLIFTHPAVERRLAAEVDEVLGGRRPTADDLKRLPYAHKVLQETLRLYPSAPFVGRQTIGEDTVRGYRIPAHTGVTMCAYVTHRHPLIWEDPERFDPERFAPDRCAARARYAYFPFGGGPRMCIGSDFAMLEAQLALAMTMQRLRFELDPSRPFAPSVRTVRPREGLWMRPQSRGPRTPHSEA